MRHALFTNSFPGLGIVPLTFAVMAAGIFLIVIVSTLLRHPKDSENKPFQAAFHHIFRDVGIALLVAAIVTFVYGSTLDFHRVSDAISMMIGADVPQSVWESTTTQVFKRDVFRANYVARWTVQPDDSLPFDQAVLKVHVEYTLYGLKPQPFNYIVKQELENIHLQNSDGSLPRFDRVAIVGGKTYQGDELNQLVKDGLLTLPPINLQAWKKTDAKSELTENSGVRLIFDRSEIISIPGTYTVILSNLTRDINLEIDHPDNIQHELKEWFDRGSKGFELTGGRYYTLNDIVLPGQSVSVQFWRQEPAPKSTPPSRNPTRTRT